MPRKHKGFHQPAAERGLEMEVVRIGGKTYRVREDKAEGFRAKMGYQRPRPPKRSGLIGHIEAISRGQ